MTPVPLTRRPAKSVPLENPVTRRDIPLSLSLGFILFGITVWMISFKCEGKILYSNGTTREAEIAFSRYGGIELRYRTAYVHPKGLHSYWEPVTSRRSPGSPLFPPAAWQHHQEAYFLSVPLWFVVFLQWVLVLWAWHKRSRRVHRGFPVEPPTPSSSPANKSSTPSNRSA